MALSRTKTWIAGEVLTASDLNAEFDNIITNAASLFSPLTGALDVDGFGITLDASGVTSLTSTAAIGFSLTPGSKTGTPGTTGAAFNLAASTFTDSNTAVSGTATNFAAYALQRPTLAATNASVTTTDAAVLYIPNNVAAGTNETLTNSWAIWVDAGNVRFDDDIYWRSGTAFHGIFAHNNGAARTYTFPDADVTIPTLATQADQETGSSTTTWVSPARQHFHPSAAKGWGSANASGGTSTPSYNLNGVTDVGTGSITFNWETDFADGNHTDVCSVEEATDNVALRITSSAAGTTNIACLTLDTPAAADPDFYHCVVFGDQA